MVSIFKAWILLKEGLYLAIGNDMEISYPVLFRMLQQRLHVAVTA